MFWIKIRNHYGVGNNVRIYQSIRANDFGIMSKYTEIVLRILGPAGRLDYLIGLLFIKI